MAVNELSTLVGVVLAAVSTRRPQLLNAAGVQTANEEQLLDIVRGLLREVIDWEDYNRRVEFTMRCMEGDIRGMLGKCVAVRHGTPDAERDGFAAVSWEDD